MREAYAYYFRRILVELAPDFAKFKRNLGHLAPVMQVPVIKSEILPARAMHLQQSTIDDNIRAIEDLHRQAGYQAADLYNYVQLVHGDLGAFEKLESAREHRAAEETPGLRMQYLIHIPGLFHVWMAGLEGLYRACSMPDLHRLESSLTHTSWGLVLDCWRLAVKAKDPRWETLADWVKSKPKWEDIVAISHEMVEQFLPGPAFDRERLTANADQVNANSKLYLRDLMDCTIFKAAVSSGDIGRVEQVLYSWVPMWKSTGKHKYARMISNFLYRLRFEYPEPLSHAIRMNWVFCPTGKNGQYRAVDWGVEELNLHTKVLWGGAGGPSRTWNLIYKHSILVGTFRKAMKSLERNFYIKSTAVLHPPPKIEKTLKRLVDGIKVVNPNKYIEGRRADAWIPNHITRGRRMMQDEINVASREVVDMDGNQPVVENLDDVGTGREAQEEWMEIDDALVDEQPQ
ncbi:uncharacterized protein EI90DRAFT_2974283 [Cantharellus anzutake]|uniref:uncharacterized protein n=1 Tax=Cantharellus anzutake TaxID=1750568 RepID=UPI001907DD7E|nr:uncharacterized protein EI90DRAFT_2974283 [Cantharellus anzutake]KAF8328520.1 hypothetical protein EI90DRAFT_2974283 [Cantharellus anzutake]